MSKITCSLCDGHNPNCWVCDGDGTIETPSKAGKWLEEANELLKSSVNKSSKIDFNKPINDDIVDGILP